MAHLFARIGAFSHRFRRVTRNGTYVPQIDGLRFLAILPVLIWHSAIRGHRVVAAQAGLPAVGEPTWLPAGEIGVELFFFISGYIIAYPFIVGSQTGKSPNLRSFYRRRLTRLEPPYIVALTLFFVVFLLSHGSSLNAGRVAAPTITPLGSYLASLVYLHAPIWKVPSTINPPIWSLEIEIQFYLIAPLLIGAYLKIRRPLLRAAIGLVAVVAAILLGAMIRRAYGEWDWRAFTLAANAYGFLLGIVASDLFYAYRTNGSGRLTRGADGLFVIGLAILIVSGFWQTGMPAWMAVARDEARLVALAALFWGAMQGRLASRVVGHPTIALLGGACYSIYLVHVPVMVAAGALLFHLVHPANAIAAFALAFAVLVPLALAAGMVFYVAVERPCMDPRWPQNLAAWARITFARRKDGAVSSRPSARS